ncbi:PREDICTED: uncharacterized protein LOC104574320 [Tinamus guttatus]|uniref:uncharacterized protein LOC104574320 n=1 Tax=Tinamus guttatus TaxID=94827 RepID=UPI00052F3741|nr:PREDICTED: uncharacterized protein LOC104574320 [Tinamus guttatus]
MCRNTKSDPLIQISEVLYMQEESLRKHQVGLTLAASRISAAEAEDTSPAALGTSYGAREAAHGTVSRLSQVPPSRRRGGDTAAHVPEGCGRGLLRDLLKALEVLELLCVNLLLCPWRKEIQSLKTFTGNFVYYIQSVLPDDILKTVLEKIGYVATTATEFSLVRKRNNEETKQTAFEIFLARIECEIMLEMTNDEKQGNLEKTLQKGTQMIWHQGDGDKEDKTLPRKDSENLENKENSETPLCPAAQPKSSTNSDKSFEALRNLKIKDNRFHLAATQSTNRLQEHQRQVTNTVHFPGKCSDSEDFLIKYSDIVIRQTPIFSENLSQKAFEEKPGGSLSEECVLAVTAQATENEIPPVPLLPGASGLPAFAAFANSSCDNKSNLEYKAQEVAEESIEAKISDAINCIDPEPVDEPNELQSLPYEDIVSVTDQRVPKDKEICELSLTFTKLQIKEAQEEVMYPVEETGQPESTAYLSTSDRSVRDFNHSKLNCAHPSNAQTQSSPAAHIVLSSNLCCSVRNREDPTNGSENKRLLMHGPATHRACGHFRHIREPPNPTYIPPQSIHVQSPSTSSPHAQGRRNLLLQPEGDSPAFAEVKGESYHSKINEIQEPYVIVDKID